MNNIGNRGDALIAFTHHYKDTVLPEGWEVLGEGCYRAAYLSPAKVVYKVQFHSDEGHDEHGYAIPDCNMREAQFYRKYKDDPMPGGFNITPCRLWGQRVLAMPLISKPTSMMWGYKADDAVRLAAHKWAQAREVYDVGGDNWLMDEAGILWLVDYAQ